MHSNSLSLITTTFEDHPLSVVEFDGRPAWVAREIGAAIGYSANGKRLVDNVREKWAGEFIEGKDFVVVRGDDLASLGTDSVPSRTPALLLLFEPGLYLALAKTSKPAGKRLRRFIVDEVMPQIVRTGQYAPAKSAAIERPAEPTAYERHKMALEQLDVAREMYKAGAIRAFTYELKQAAAAGLSREDLHPEIASRRKSLSEEEMARALTVPARLINKALYGLDFKSADHDGVPGMSRLWCGEWRFSPDALYAVFDYLNRRGLR